MNTAKKRIPKRAQKAYASLFDPFKDKSTVIVQKFGRKPRRSKRITFSRGILSEKEHDLLDRDVSRPDVSRAWARKKLD